jgi:hypothetical protein
MPLEHIVFIPTVFLLGFFLGGVVATRAERSRSRGTREDSAGRRAQDSAGKRTSGWTLLGSFTLVAIAFISTHVLPLFGGPRALGIALSGQRLFDQQPSFSSTEVYARLSAFGAVGRAMYQRFTYTADVIFPLILLMFLVLLARFVGDRTSFGTRSQKALAALPFIWFSFDMMENAMVFVLIAGFTGRHDTLAGALGFVTAAKFGLLLLSIAVPLLSSVLFRRRNEEFRMAPDTP